MNTESAHIYWAGTLLNKSSSSATIYVPGLGSVEIKDFISDDLRVRIAAEAEFALQQKLGVKCSFSSDAEKEECEN